MRRAICTALLLDVLLCAGVAAQDKSAAEKKPASSSSPKTLTLTGCVEKGTMPNQVTLSDPDNGKYAVNGDGVEKMVGQRIEVLGTPGSTRFRIKGGLYPTPNVAGQAGAIDPAKAAVAAQPGGGARGTGDVDLPTLKVRSLRSVDGGCK